MAVVCKPGQVIDLCTEAITSCECTEDRYCIAVEQTDMTTFQVDLTEVDGAELVADGGFATGCGAGNWLCGADWTIAAGLASYAAGLSNAVEQTLASLDLDTYYRIQFTYLNSVNGQTDVLFGGNNIAASIDLPSPSDTLVVYWYLDSKTNDKIEIFGNIGSFDIDDVSIKKISLPDDFTIKDDAGNTDFTFAYTAISQPGLAAFGQKSTNTLTHGAPAEATIETIEAQSLITINWANLGLVADCYTVCVADFESRCFTLATNHPCTLELSFTNSANAFGLNFEDFTFTQYLRIDARRRNPRYQYNERIHEDDSGSYTLTYARKTKIYSFDTEPLPRDLLTAINCGLLMDDFQIDGVRHVREISEISPSWNKNYVLAPLQLEIKEASQPNQVNRLC